eukprot:TRINITY_DN64239_c0_g2_i1.p1 TRINITY_DN64239_c0_g2~~TRINITY_DN64239_c0_g2_i1.p1  ORF type:complete len:707 (+),score=372.99 TRINITY_DN64239_c0_g2_i1:248-2122(+)
MEAEAERRRQQEAMARREKIRVEASERALYLQSVRERDFFGTRLGQVPMWVQQSRQAIATSEEWRECAKLLWSNLEQRLASDQISYFCALQDHEQLAYIEAINSELLQTSEFAALMEVTQVQVDRYLSEQVAQELENMRKVGQKMTMGKAKYTMNHITAIVTKILEQQEHVVTHKQSGALRVLINGHLPPDIRRKVWRIMLRPMQGDQKFVSLMRNTDALVSNETLNILTTFRRLVVDGGVLDGSSFEVSTQLLTHAKTVLSFYVALVKQHLTQVVSHDAFFVVVPLLYVMSSSHDSSDSANSHSAHHHHHHHHHRHHRQQSPPSLMMKSSDKGVMGLIGNFSTLVRMMESYRHGLPWTTATVTTHDKVLRDSMLLDEVLEMLKRVDKPFARELELSLFYDKDSNLRKYVGQWLGRCLDRMFVGQVPLDTAVYIWDTCILSDFELFVPLCTVYFLLMKDRVRSIIGLTKDGDDDATTAGGKGDGHDDDHEHEQPHDDLDVQAARLLRVVASQQRDDEDHRNELDTQRGSVAGTARRGGVDDASNASNTASPVIGVNSPDQQGGTGSPSGDQKQQASDAGGDDDRLRVPGMVDLRPDAFQFHMEQLFMRDYRNRYNMLQFLFDKL